MRRKPENPIKVEVVNPRATILDRVAKSVPLFISALALALSAFSVHETISHDKLSVKPAVSFLRNWAKEDSLIGLTVENNGLGPAIIAEYSIYFYGKKMVKDGHADWDGVTQNVRFLFPGKVARWKTMGNGYMLRPGEAMNLYVTEPENVPDIAAFREVIFNHAIVELKVCSLYDECVNICSAGHGCGRDLAEGRKLDAYASSIKW